jgi:hypothetical protein
MPDVSTMLQRVSAIGAAYTAYNPSDDSILQECAGNGYWFPPDLGGALVPHFNKKGPDGRPLMVPADGKLAIRDHIDERGIVGVPARTIADVLCRHLEGRGVVLLTGGPEDADYVKIAKAKYRSYRRAQAKMYIDSWTERMGNFLRNPANAGKTPPAMPESVQRAQEFFDDMESDTVKKYVCQYDGYSTDDDLRFQKHMHVNHSSLSAVAPAAAPPEARQEPPVPSVKPIQFPEAEKGRK